MQIQLTGHQLEISDSLKDYVYDKFRRIERHLDNISNVHVILQVEKYRHSAEATIKVSGGELFAKSQSEGSFAAVDTLVDKLDRQAIKHKEKMNRHKHPTGKVNDTLIAGSNLEESPEVEIA